MYMCYWYCLSYLGELDEEAVASVQEEETTILLPLLCIPERVVFPGETVPMHIQNPHVRREREREREREGERSEGKKRIKKSKYYIYRTSFRR